MCEQSANESALETMIKDMRRELALSQQESWRLDECVELGDMKERLMMSMLPRNITSAESEQLPETVVNGFAALNALNDEMDDELDALMEKLGSVKHQFSSLDAQRRSLQVLSCSLVFAFRAQCLSPVRPGCTFSRVRKTSCKNMVTYIRMTT